MIESLITEQITKFHKDQNKRRFHEHFVMESLLSEADESTPEVTEMIRNDVWESEGDVAQLFFDSYNKSKYAEVLTPYSVADLNNLKLYKVKGLDIGFAIKGDGEIVAVHNNSGVKGVGTELVKAAIKNGGRHLDHFDGFLTGFYKSLGFKMTSKLAWDDQYAPDNWKYTPVNIMDSKSSVYADEIKNLVQTKGIRKASDLPEEFQEAIKRYKAGKPDVIFRKI